MLRFLYESATYIPSMKLFLSVIPQRYLEAYMNFHPGDRPLEQGNPDSDFREIHSTGQSGEDSFQYVEF